MTRSFSSASCLALLAFPIQFVAEPRPMASFAGLVCVSTSLPSSLGSKPQMVRYSLSPGNAASAAAKAAAFVGILPNLPASAMAFVRYLAQVFTALMAASGPSPGPRGSAARSGENFISISVLTPGPSAALPTMRRSALVIAKRSFSDSLYWSSGFLTGFGLDIAESMRKRWSASCCGMPTKLSSMTPLLKRKTEGSALTPSA
mmetsp:Transcript_45335/g.142126  ORF Transcript_45335/g.142126 Transcript_45335/m.142126 type:complete len:203 (-) Transcript_45335:729-1337(-)